MSDIKVYIVSLKGKFLPGSSVNNDGSEFCYGDIYVPAENEDIAKEMAAEYMLESKIIIDDFYACMIYRPEDWTDKKGQSFDPNFYAKKAAELNEIVWGYFESSESRTVD